MWAVRDSRSSSTPSATAGMSEFMTNVAGVGGPGHDLHLLLAELGGDRALAHSVAADARSLGIDVAIGRVDGHLGPPPGVAGDGADHDLAGLQLGDLLLHEPLDELRMRPRYHHDRIRVPCGGPRRSPP